MYPIPNLMYVPTMKKNSYQDARRASGRKYVLNSNLERKFKLPKLLRNILCIHFHVPYEGFGFILIGVE